MKKHQIQIIDGPEGPCVALNGTRIAGPKPWGGGRVLLSEEVETLVVDEALGHEELHVLFAGEPPNLAFVEVESPLGTSIGAGQWSTDERGYKILTLHR